MPELGATAGPLSREPLCASANHTARSPRHWFTACPLPAEAPPRSHGPCNKKAAPRGAARVSAFTAAAARQDLGAEAGIAAAGTCVLGGLLAVPAGECAPDDSIGLAAGGVYAKGPGSIHAAPDAVAGLADGVVLR